MNWVRGLGSGFRYDLMVKMMIVIEQANNPLA